MNRNPTSQPISLHPSTLVTPDRKAAQHPHPPIAAADLGTSLRWFRGSLSEPPLVRRRDGAACVGTRLCWRDYLDRVVLPDDRAGDGRRCHRPLDLFRLGSFVGLVDRHPIRPAVGRRQRVQWGDVFVYCPRSGHRAARIAAAQGDLRVVLPFEAEALCADAALRLHVVRSDALGHRRPASNLSGSTIVPSGKPCIAMGSGTAVPVTTVSVTSGISAMAPRRGGCTQTSWLADRAGPPTGTKTAYSRLHTGTPSAPSAPSPTTAVQGSKCSKVTDVAHCTIHQLANLKKSITNRALVIPN
eukprot:7350497-Prymnesium_polylepis.1